MAEITGSNNSSRSHDVLRGSTIVIAVVDFLLWLFFTTIASLGFMVFLTFAFAVTAIPALVLASKNKVPILSLALALVFLVFGIFLIAFLIPV
jgi:hypothetical protein